MELPRLIAAVLKVIQLISVVFIVISMNLYPKALHAWRRTSVPMNYRDSHLIARRVDIRLMSTNFAGELTVGDAQSSGETYHRVADKKGTERQREVNTKQNPTASKPKPPLFPDGTLVRVKQRHREKPPLIKSSTVNVRKDDIGFTEGYIVGNRQRNGWYTVRIADGDTGSEKFLKVRVADMDLQALNDTTTTACSKDVSSSASDTVTADGEIGKPGYIEYSKTKSIPKWDARKGGSTELRQKAGLESKENVQEEVPLISCLDRAALPSAHAEMRRWLLFSDLHVKASSVDVCEQVLETVHAEALHRGAGIAFLGDFWHVRGSLSVDLLNRVLKALSSWSVPVIMIPGNHDQVTLGGRIHSLEPLQYAFAPGQALLLSEPTAALGALWLPYRRDQRLLRRILAEAAGRTDIGAVFCHADVCGAFMNDQLRSRDGLDVGCFPPHLPVYSGHFHKPHTLKKCGSSLRYVGSPYQTSLSEAGQTKFLYCLGLSDIGHKPSESGIHSALLRPVWQELERWPIQVGGRFFKAASPTDATAWSGARAGDRVVMQVPAGQDLAAERCVMQLHERGVEVELRRQREGRGERGGRGRKAGIEPATARATGSHLDQTALDDSSDSGGALAETTAPSADSAVHSELFGHEELNPASIFRSYLETISVFPESPELLDEGGSGESPEEVSSSAVQHNWNSTESAGEEQSGSVSTDGNGSRDTQKYRAVQVAAEGLATIEHLQHSLALDVPRPPSTSSSSTSVAASEFNLELDSVSLSDFGPFGGVGAVQSYPLSRRGLVLLRGLSSDGTGADSNGAGKSTLAMSVMWCLTGSLDPRLISDSKPGDVAFDAARSAHAETELELDPGPVSGGVKNSATAGRAAASTPTAEVTVRGRINGQDFETTRRRGARKTELLFAVAGQDLTTQAVRDTQAVVDSTLGIGGGLLQRCCFFGQHSHTLQSLLGLSDTRLKGELASLVKSTELWVAAAQHVRQRERQARQQLRDWAVEARVRGQELRRLQEAQAAAQARAVELLATCTEADDKPQSEVIEGAISASPIAGSMNRDTERQGSERQGRAERLVEVRAALQALKEARLPTLRHAAFGMPAGPGHRRTQSNVSIASTTASSSDRSYAQKATGLVSPSPAAATEEEVAQVESDLAQLLAQAASLNGTRTASAAACSQLHRKATQLSGRIREGAAAIAAQAKILRSLIHSDSEGVLDSYRALLDSLSNQISLQNETNYSEKQLQGPDGLDGAEEVPGDKFSSSGTSSSSSRISGVDSFGVAQVRQLQQELRSALEGSVSRLAQLDARLDSAQLALARLQGQGELLAVPSRNSSAGERPQSQAIPTATVSAPDTTCGHGKSSEQLSLDGGATHAEKTASDSGESACPTCGQALSPQLQHSRLEELSARIIADESARSAETAARARWQQGADLCSKIVQQLDHRCGLLQQLEELGAEQRAEQVTLEQADRAAAEVGAQVARQKQQLEQLRHCLAAEQAGRLRALEEAEQEARLLEAEERSLLAHAEAERRRREAQRQIKTEGALRLAQAQEAASSTEEAVRALSEVLRAKEAEVAELAKMIPVLEQLGWIFGPRGVQNFVFQHLIVQLEAVANAYLQVLAEGGIQLALDSTGSGSAQQAQAQATERIVKSVWVRSSTDGRLRERALSSLSGGQWRRVSLALDLAFVEVVRARGLLRCNLLVMDEVLNHLDASGREAVGTLLRLLVRGQGQGQGQGDTRRTKSTNILTSSTTTSVNAAAVAEIDIGAAAVTEMEAASEAHSLLPPLVGAGAGAFDTVLVILQDLSAAELEEAFDHIDVVHKAADAARVSVDG